MPSSDSLDSFRTTTYRRANGSQATAAEHKRHRRASFPSSDYGDRRSTPRGRGGPVVIPGAACATVDAL